MLSQVAAFQHSTLPGSRSVKEKKEDSRASIMAALGQVVECMQASTQTRGRTSEMSSTAAVSGERLRNAAKRLQATSDPLAVAMPQIIVGPNGHVPQL